MKQLNALTAFLIGLDLVAYKQIDPAVENPQVSLLGTYKGANSIVLCRINYDVRIIIERFPHKIHQAELLFGHIAAWLMDNDGERCDGSEATIQTEVDILDDDTADLIITIDFVEDVTAIEDPAGTIQLAGKRYRLAPADIYYAETGDVIADAVT